MSQNGYRFDTLALHAGQTPESDTRATAVPIYQTVAYDLQSTQHAKELFELKTPGNIYARLHNPTTAVLEERLAALEGGEGALCVASGHAALFNTMINLCSAGDEIVASNCLYGGAINLLGVALKNFGIKTTFVDPDNFDAWENAINGKTKAVFFENISNPNASIVDTARVADIAHRHGVPVVVDSTLATPYLHRPIEDGADIVIHSTTKMISGHGTALGGAVIDSGRFVWEDNPRFEQYNNPDVSYHGAVFAKDFGRLGFVTRLRALVMRDTGPTMSPFTAFLTLMGIETLSLRMQRASDNTLAVAKYLEKHPAVKFINYPGLESSKYHELAKRYCPKGSGNVFTFGLKGGREACARLIDSIKLFDHVANLGDSRSMLIHSASTTHSQLNDEQLAAAGISAETIRVSIGIEDINDIIEALEAAIAIAVK